MKLINFKRLLLSIETTLKEAYESLTLAYVNHSYSELLMRKLKIENNQQKLLDDYNEVVDQILEMAPAY